MKELFPVDPQQALHADLEVPRRNWAANLAARNPAYLRLNPEPRIIEPGDSAVTLEPRPATLQELEAEYRGIYAPRHGAIDMALAMRENGIIREIQEVVKAGGKVAVMSSHLMDMDPAILTDVLAMAFNDPEMTERTNVVLGVGMEDLDFMDNRITDILRRRARVLITAPDTENGRYFIPDELFDRLSRAFIKEHKAAIKFGGLTVLNPSGTIDKLQGDGRIKMHAVKPSGATLIRNYDSALPIALLSSPASDGVHLSYKIGGLAEIPRGKDHSKEETRDFVHQTMGQIAEWATVLTNGAPEVYYETPQEPAEEAA